MRVVIIRHAEVDFCWSRRCTSELFDSECRKYDLFPIKNVSYKIPKNVYRKIYVSEFSRSQDTAKKLFPNGEYFESGLINEVPLKSSFDTKVNMPLWFWNLTGRLQWFVNSGRQVEGRRQTRERAKEFVEMIGNDDMDVAVVTHGFFMHTLLKEMKKVGFKMTGASVKFKNGEYVIAAK
ncbi:MAG: histidine phosphatase family protein [Eubacterium sp.]|nr:histidine phosphatase family protein [Eubacterium sp.]